MLVTQNYIVSKNQVIEVQMSEERKDPFLVSVWSIWEL